MLRNLLILLLFVALPNIGISQDLTAFKIYNENGKSVKIKKLLNALGDTQIILFGEQHNNPICHWLQLEVSKYLLQNTSLIFGAEMFEADNQVVLNQYLKVEINAAQFDSLMRLWPNYATDYAPLLELAKENQFPFIATNIPRKYARLVYKDGFEGLDSLTAEELKFIAPLPIPYDAELPGYKAMLEMGHGHGGENLPKAQAIKDATMAHFVVENLVENHPFIHFNGTYHSDNFEGIYWYLKQLNPDLKITTISAVEQINIHQLENEHIGKANFIICVDEDMTKTY
jgi:uncharacterized iron-regulated protein